MNSDGLLIYKSGQKNIGSSSLLEFSAKFLSFFAKLVGISPIKNTEFYFGENELVNLNMQFSQIQQEYKFSAYYDSTDPKNQVNYLDFISQQLSVYDNTSNNQFQDSFTKLLLQVEYNNTYNKIINGDYHGIPVSSIRSDLINTDVASLVTDWVNTNGGIQTNLTPTEVNRLIVLARIAINKMGSTIKNVEISSYSNNSKYNKTFISFSFYATDPTSPYFNNPLTMGLNPTDLNYANSKLQLIENNSRRPVSSDLESALNNSIRIITNNLGVSQDFSQISSDLEQITSLQKSQNLQDMFTTYLEGKGIKYSTVFSTIKSTKTTNSVLDKFINANG